MLIQVQKSDAEGNVYILQNRWGKRIEWNGKTFTIPRGFKSDGASVPRLFWRVVFPPSDPTALRAAFAHDYIYREQPEGWTRAEADKMFFDLMVADGVSRFRAGLAYIAVRLCGGVVWRKHAEEKAAGRVQA